MRIFKDITEMSIQDSQKQDKKKRNVIGGEREKDAGSSRSSTYSALCRGEKTKLNKYKSCNSQRNCKRKFK